MSRRRSEWPEPWVRLAWSPGDAARIERLLAATLTDRDRRFVEEMQAQGQSTLQQVAWLRKLAKRYRLSSFGGDPVRDEQSGEAGARRIELDEDV